MFIVEAFFQKKGKRAEGGGVKNPSPTLPKAYNLLHRGVGGGSQIRLRGLLAALPPSENPPLCDKLHALGRGGRFFTLPSSAPLPFL